MEERGGGVGGGIGSRRGGGQREMTGREWETVEGKSGEGDLEGCASVTWQAADEGRLAANEREVGGSETGRQIAGR